MTDEQVVAVPEEVPVTGPAPAGRNLVNPLRHMEIFSPSDFGDRRIDVIGVGATGSKIALSLAKHGVRNLHIWDFDTVEEHNIANQAYALADIGKLKVDALAAIIAEQTGLAVTRHNEAVDGTQELGEVVFLLVDKMDVRREIYEKGLKLKPQTQLVIETRMGTKNGRIYIFCPSNMAHIQAWEKTLYTSAEAQVSACGTAITVGATGDIVCGIAVSQFISWFALEEAKEGAKELDHEIIFTTSPFMLVTRKFQLAI